MINPDGTAIWYELVGPNPAVAQTFYSAVIGWTIADSGMPGMDYRLATAPDGSQVGGLMLQPEGMPFAPGWLIYYGVADVDAAVVRIQDLGGSVHMPPTDIPGVGRFALVADPQGVIFYIMRGNGDEPSKAFLQGPDAYGHGVWNELITPDPDAAFDFYGKLFGWTKEGSMPMGPMGDYDFIGAGEARPGAMMSSTKTGAPAAWGNYFHVPDIDAAIATAKASGGTLRQGPDPIPGGDFSAKLIDPDGAAFGLVGSRKG